MHVESSYNYLLFISSTLQLVFVRVERGAGQKMFIYMCCRLTVFVTSENAALFFSC